MKAKLKGSHPNNYIKVEVKPGLFVSISKRFHSLPDEYADKLCAHEWLEVEGAPAKKKEKPVKVEPKVEAVEEPVKKKKSFLRALKE